MAEYSGRDKRLAYLFDAIENVQVDDMTGASASTDGAHGLAPAPLAGDEDKFLKGDGTWATVQAGAGALSGLSDVDLSSPTDGQALVYDGANNKWINGNVSGGGETLLIQDASIYSTDEQVVGVWTDGKPLYQRTFFSNSSTTRTNATYDFSQDIPDIELVTDREFGLKLAGSSWISGTYTNTQTYRLDCMVNADAKNISWQALSWGFSDAFCTFRYTKTTDAAGSGGYKAYGLSPIIYSTEEREVGVWTDGKPLYQKTLYYNEHLYGDINKDVTALNIDTCVDISGMTGEHSQWGYCTTFGYARQSSSANITALYSSQNKQLQLRFGSDYSSSVYFNGCNITLLYTKTTDTAGSGTWTTTGEYAHHYSTSEKVIGTWTDGSTIYERTWSGLNQSVTANAWNVITGISIANFGILINAQAYRTSGHGLTGLGVRAFQNSGNSSSNPQIVPLESQTLDTLILQYTKTAS